MDSTILEEDLFFLLSCTVDIQSDLANKALERKFLNEEVSALVCLLDVREDSGYVSLVLICDCY